MASTFQVCKVTCNQSQLVMSSHSIEENAATIDMYGKRVQIFLYRHSCAIAEFFRVLLQQFDAMIVEPFGTFDYAAQIFCMRQSIEAFEICSCETGDNRSPIVIA